MIANSKKAYAYMKRFLLMMFVVKTKLLRFMNKVMWILGVMKVRFVLIADYQMVMINTYITMLILFYQDKHLPHFRKTPQVSFSFFSYHLGISIFGLIDATREKNYLYFTDKLQAGAKNSDHTISYIYQYVIIYHYNFILLISFSYLDNYAPWWMRKIIVFIDNAGINII